MYDCLTPINLRPGKPAPGPRQCRNDGPSAPFPHQRVRASVAALILGEENYSLYSKLPYHPIRDFTPIALVGDSPNVLVLNPRVPANSIKELITLAKSWPGALNCGCSGAGTSVPLSGGLFHSMAGVKMDHVPYKGATEALTALLGGQLDSI